MSDASAFEDHFRRPRNAGLLEHADGRIEVENPVCGDLLTLTWRRATDGRLAELKFQVYGCPAAIAAGSVATELALGKSAADLERVTADAVADSLGGLDASSAHAAVLAADALHELAHALRAPEA